MKKLFFPVLIALSVVSCSKKSDSTSEYSNNLRLGTGFTSNYMDLVGIGTSFPVESSIYFRLESADDMGGSAVRIKIDKQDGTAYTSYDYTNPQSYGHIFLSSFSSPAAGNYKATGILVTGLKTVASINFTVY